MVSKRKPARTSTNTIRIIGGEWRRRTVPVPDAPGLRPTGNRIRETLFNWLMADIHGAHCLDMFAGTGALGIEALSRGAAHVHFAEKDTATAQQLKTNLHTLAGDASRFYLHQGNCIHWLTQLEQRFDVIFIDPPFAAQLWQQACDALEQSNCLADNALIYVESPLETKVDIPLGWRIHKEIHTSTLHACLYKRNPQ